MRDTQYGNWQRHAAILPSAYVSMIDEAGGIPLIIPPAGDMTNLLKSIDGLIISGGPDVSPTLYGQTPGPRTKEFYPDQDETEIGLISSALEMDMPLLGVCRGMQILSIAHGGSLHQHLDDTPGHEGHGGYDGESTDHGVIVEKDSILAELMGTSFFVNSTHHQGVADPGSLNVSAIAEHDGLIEAVERKDKKFCLGVQWHPERKGHDLLFAALVKAARG